MISPYELSSQQVAQVKEWLQEFDPCPWCGVQAPASQEQIKHREDCLLAEIAGEPRA